MYKCWLLKLTLFSGMIFCATIKSLLFFFAKSMSVACNYLRFTLISLSCLVVMPEALRNRFALFSR